MYKFESSICFEEIEIFGDEFEFGMKLKNKMVFKFMECYYSYSYTKEETYLNAYYYSDDNNIEKANAKLKNSTGALSYIFTIPIIREIEVFEEAILVDLIDVIESEPYTKKMIKLHELENKIKDLDVDQKNLFNYSINHFCNGLKFLCMDGLEEEAFINFFKSLEIIASYYFDSKEKKEAMNFNPNMADKALQKFIYDTLNITYSPQKMESICGNFKGFIKKQISNIYSKISLFANDNKIVVNLSELGEIVNIRNDIAHGKVVSNKVKDLSSLSKEFIAIYFFKTKYDKIQFDARIYDSYVIFTDNE